MKVGKPSGAGAVSFNFTPVIDIVFDLLIFFVLTAQFSVIQFEEVNLPMSTAGEIRDYAEFQNVVINIVNKSNPTDPAIMVLGQPLNRQQLVECLKGINEKCKAEGSTLNVILRADAEVAFDQVALAMWCAGKADIGGWWMQVDISEESKKLVAEIK
jgi:biopolymer transport protein ExbD